MPNVSTKFRTVPALLIRTVDGKFFHILAEDTMEYEVNLNIVEYDVSASNVAALGSPLYHSVTLWVVNDRG